MSHFPPDTAEGETCFWQRLTQMQWKGGFLMNVRGTEYWNDYSILNLHLSREQISELPPYTNCRGFSLLNTLSNYYKNLLQPLLHRLKKIPHALWSLKVSEGVYRLPARK